MNASVKTVLPAAVVMFATAACTHHTIETTSEVKPIHIVIDVNVKVDKDLDKFFSEADKAALQQELKQKTADAAQAAVEGAVKEEAKPAAPAAPSAAQAIPVTLEYATQRLTAESAPVREVMMGRFAARRPVVKDLKTRGVIGEDAKGYLQFVTDKKESEAVVAAENSDREIVYERVAKKQGVTAVKAAQIRAEKNVKEALPGEFLQDAAGKWAQKAQ